MDRLRSKQIKLPEDKRIRKIEGLVLLEDLTDDFIIDLKYATKENFLKKAVYPVPLCVIKKETGERLIKANNIFKERGYTIKVWDAYRPLHVQKIFYDIYPDPNFVAKPPEVHKLSKFRPTHYNGMSVDITLVDCYGKELEMPTAFDDFTEKASATSDGMTKDAKENVTYMIQVMAEVGFRNYELEWWHFSDILTPPTTYLDVPLEVFKR